LKEFGDPRQFCEEKQLKQIPLKMDQLFLKNMEAEPDVNNELYLLKLTSQH